MEKIKNWIKNNKFWALLITGILVVVAGLTENALDDKYAKELDDFVKETVETVE